MNIEKSVWKQLGKINPEFLTGNDYPSRAEFFKAKAAALVAELENLGNKFEKCMSAINKLSKAIEANEQQQ